MELFICTNPCLLHTVTVRCTAALFYHILGGFLYQTVEQGARDFILDTVRG
jgi:hypothetical protein